MPSLTLPKCIIVLLSILCTPFTHATPAPQPEAPGPFATQTLAFPDLTDSSRAARRVPIKVFAPTPLIGTYPIIVFSHGGGGGWDANYAQATHLASHGYIVLAPEHIGSNLPRLKKGFRFRANLHAMTRDADEVLNRPRDISFALDTATLWNTTHPQLKGHLDLEHIGVAGHSFGAYTALVIAGARPALDWLTPTVAPGSGLGPDLSDPRVLACVALSPQGPGEPFFLETSYATLRIPVLGITGSADDQQGDIPPENRRRILTLSPPGKVTLLWLTNADHNAFSDSTGSNLGKLRSPSRAAVQPLTRAATLLFFDAHLRTRPTPPWLPTLRPLLHPPVTDIEVLTN